MLTKELIFDYPKNRIALYPSEKRDHSNLMVLDRKTKSISHYKFYDVHEILKRDDVLVYNDTKVLKARFHGKKESGGRVEILFLKKLGNLDDFECLIKNAKGLKEGSKIYFNDSKYATVISNSNLENFTIRLNFKNNIENFFKEHGAIPLPPYIKRQYNEELDSERYQTVFAKNDGSIAAPTAGLHFTKELVESLKEKGIIFVPITLDINYGTFKPINTQHVEDHEMYEEKYILSKEASEILNEAKLNQRRIIAIGTTSVRALESSLTENNFFEAKSATTTLFIYPGFRFKAIDSLITNFHMPKSTLMCLVVSFAGLDFIRKAYKEAIYNNYRLFSYGDAMLII